MRYATSNYLFLIRLEISSAGFFSFLIFQIMFFNLMAGILIICHWPMRQIKVKYY